MKKLKKLGYNRYNKKNKITSCDYKNPQKTKRKQNKTKISLWTEVGVP